MERNINEINGEIRGVLQEINITEASTDFQSNLPVNDTWHLPDVLQIQQRRQSLRPRPRVTYADMSPTTYTRSPSPQLSTDSFTFEPEESIGDGSTMADKRKRGFSGSSQDIIFETPPKTPRSSQRNKSPSKRLINASSPSVPTQPPFTIHIDSPVGGSPIITVLHGDPSPAKKPKMSLSDQATLAQQLASLTNDQLVDVVDKIIVKYPEIHQEVVALLPEPDIIQSQERLSQLLHNIFRAMPRTRLASTRGALSYRQVRVHLQEFKKYCIQQCRHLVSCRAWTAVVSYVLMAWQLVNYLPIWENGAHNTVRSQCLKALAACCSKALKLGNLDHDSLEELRPRLNKACRLNSAMQPCIDALHTRLDGEESTST